MNLIIRHEGMASHFIYTGLGKAFQALGYNFKFWDADSVPAFDAFQEAEPTFFIGQGYNLDRATIKCLVARKDYIKVLLKVGCHGPVATDVVKHKFPILMASMDEISNVRKLTEQLPPENIALFNYVHPSRKDYLMEGWNTLAKTHGLLLAADTHSYQQVEPDQKLKCDVGFVGGYWPYKGINFDKYLIPLCYPVGKYDIKIFGNQAWPVPQYMGGATETTVNKLFASATICPNISEPHANVLGYEINERVFKLALAKSLVISDYIESLEKDVFTHGELLSYKDFAQFKELIDHFITYPEQRQKHIDRLHKEVVAKHTYEHRVKDILELFNPTE